MLNLGSEIALAVGVKIEVRREHALSVSQDTDRATPLSGPSPRSGLSIGIKKSASNLVQQSF